METHIESINRGINAVLKELNPASDLLTYGLAESVTGRDETSNETLPVIVLPDGECYDVYREADKHDVVLYHKLNEIGHTEASNDSFGSGRTYTSVSDMSLLVYGKRAKFSQYTVEGIARKVIASVNARTLVRSDFNALQIFANEYPGVTFFLGPEYYLFKINYRITSTYNPRCTKIQ